MDQAQRLLEARNILLKLHKAMLDIEREMYEGIHGKLTPSQFVNLLMEDDDLSWLRKFSRLIVDIDEMFASKADMTDIMIAENYEKVRALVEMTEPDDYFRAKYQFALQRDPNAAGLHGQLKLLLLEE